MTLSLVIFDVDGTLVDSQAHILAAMELAFAETDYAKPDRDSILSIVGLSLDAAFLRLCPQATNPERDVMIDAYKNAFHSLRSSMPRSPLYPGALDCLKRLADMPDVLLGIATGKSKRGLDHVLDAHDLSRFFVTNQCADFHPSKPHPSMCQTAMQQAGADRGIMVGDTTFDMEMGKAAGLATIGVTWGYHTAAELADASDRLANTFSDVPELTDQIWNEE